MSFASIRSFAFSGIEAVPVEVQVQISSGLPAFLVVGLPDKAVGEARERVRAALTAMGLSLPPRRVLINLAPADLLKEGSHFDLPMALAVLAAMEVLPREDISHYAAIGELSLDGSLNPVVGVLPAAIGAGLLELGLICPGSQGGEAAWAGSVEVLAPPDLLSLINHFRGTQVLTPPETSGLQAPCAALDLAEVRGMETARRALEIAAAGGHNLLLVGPPGAGKSMLAARLPGLLPDLLPAEALEVSMIHSVAGMLDGGRLLRRPPFREPHHNASQAALVGGGCKFQRITGLYRGSLDSVSTLRQDALMATFGVLLVDDVQSLPRGQIAELCQLLGEASSMPPGRRPICVAAVRSEDGHVPPPLRDLARRSFDLVASLPLPPPGGWIALPQGEPTSAVARRVRAARGRAGSFARSATPLRRLALDHLGEAKRRFGIDGLSAESVTRVAGTIACLAGRFDAEPHDVSEALWLRLRQPMPA